MKKIFLLAIASISIAFVSCKKDSKTLQGYLVDKQEESRFATFDFSTNILPIQLKENASSQDKRTLESVTKVNIAFLSKNKATEQEIKKEKATLKQILKSSDYKKLISFKKKGVNFNAYYAGDAEAIDEMIISGYGREFGVGVIRLLGKNINPTAFMSLIQNGNFSVDDSFINRIKKMK